MQRLKDAGLDPTKPIFSDDPSPEGVQIYKVPSPETCMTKPGVDRKITAEELAAHNQENEPWFAVNGEVRRSYSGRICLSVFIKFGDTICRSTTAPAF